jgi:hypothetical protein
VYAFHRKHLQWQEPVNSGNLVAFATVMDFLDKNDGKRPSAENETGTYYATLAESVRAIPVLQPFLDSKFRCWK